MAPSSVVIKVKYGDTLRRFSAAVNEDQRLDLDLERLRTKICSLFNFRPDEGFVLTYIDEDDDLVTLADDEDLHDVMKQGLNPIRITVHLNVDKGAQSSARSAGSPTLDRSSSQNSVPGKKPGAGEILKSVPEPIIDALSKLSHEVASKAATASPVLADLINDLSKVGQSYLNASHSSSGSTTENSHEGRNDNQNSAAREKQGASANEGKRPNGTQGSTLEQTAPMSSSVSVPPDVKGERPVEPVRHPKHHPCFRKKGKSANSGYIHYMPAGDGIKENDFAAKCLADSIWRSKKKDKEIERDSAGRSGGPLYGSVQTQLEKQSSSKKETDESNPSENTGSQRSESSTKSAWNPNFMGECPFSGSPFQPPYMQLPNRPFRRSFNNSADGMAAIFHHGIRCDGCGVLPITGPRFKSKVKHDYDLCSICFSRTGNEADYARIDFPLPYRHPGTMKGFYDPMFNHLPSIQASPLLRPHAAKQLHSRLDSRFIMDVNIMDGTLMDPSTPFTKIWRMRNNGTRPWVRGLQLLWIGGDRFSATDSVGIEIPIEGVSTGNEIDIAVDFIAPELSGRYVSYWRMAEPNGHKFGQRVWVLIQVEAAAAAKNSTNESSPVLNSDLTPGNASSSTCEDLSVVDINLPPGNACSSAHESSSVVNLNLDVNAEPTGGVDGSGDLASAVEGITPSMIKQKGNTETLDVNFPINDDLLVPGRGSSQPIHLPLPFPFPEFSANSQHKPSSDTSASFMAASSSTLSSYSPEKQSFPKSSQVSYPVVDASAEQKPASVFSSVSYPIIDMSEEPPLIPSNATKDDDNKKNEQVRGENDVEETLLKELEEMGFKQVHLNKEVLQKNEYDLERSVDDLCDVSGWWDPILEELREMGFQDKATNRKLLVKNNGSIMRVVMDLIAGEKA